jgi:glycosyltransferase involved in cell wall biosynthesis
LRTGEPLRQYDAAYDRPAPKPQAGGGAPDDAETINVFVHLARDKDAVEWRRAQIAGTLVGVNDETPYGYGRASNMGCRVTFSRSDAESPFSKLLRLGIRAVTGFDYLHACRQRDALARADVVWTHTESQYLAVAAALLGAKHRPKLLGQSVWLFDRWARLNRLHKALYRRLIDKVDVLTCLSEENRAIARGLFARKRVEFVPFGVPSEKAISPTPRAARAIRILAVGNDRDRDWKTLIAAVAPCEGVSLLILSRTAPASLARGVANVRIARVNSNAELIRHFAEATVVCVPLKPNMHASGITVIQEAVLAGVPVVASDTGGLTSYFGRDELRYARPGDAAALREAIMATAKDPIASCAMAARAQKKFTVGALGSEVFVRRHVELSREMLRQ